MTEDGLVSRLPPAARMLSVRSGRELTRSGIVAAVDDRAQSIAALGLQHGDRMVVGEPDPVDYVLSLFACWQMGLVAVGVNPALSLHEQRNVVEATGARGWIGPNALDLPVSSERAVARALDLDEPALILMTSGTTGKPKGIVHSQRTLLARIEHNIAQIGADALSETLCVLPVFFGHGLIGNGLTSLLAGGRVHFWPTPTAAEMPGVGPYIAGHRIRFMSSVPSFWKLAARLSPPPAEPLRRVHIGSAPLSISQWRQIARWCGTEHVFNMFGMTETANWIAGGAVAEAAERDGYVGTAWGGELAVLGDDEKIAGSGRGEVLVRSPSIMLGYWQRADLNAEAFIDGWFRTGDIGELEGGRLTLVGRIKTEINRGGIKVLAEEVDMLLERHPDIAEACAFGMPDAVAGETVAAAIVLKTGTPFEPEVIKAWCRQHARPDAVPSRLYALEAIPRNDRGKIVRADVRRFAESGG